MDSLSGSKLMLVSRDGSFLLAGNTSGMLTQISVRGRGVVRKFGKVATDISRICD